MFKNAFEQVLKESYLLPTAQEVQRIFDEVEEQLQRRAGTTPPVMGVYVPNPEAIKETEILLNIRDLRINNLGRVSAYRNH